MQHELLAACLGHGGDIIRGGSEGFTVRPGVRFLSPPEQQAINRVARLGAFFSFLERFASGKFDGGAGGGGGGSGGGDTGGREGSLYLRAFRDGVQGILDDFVRAVAALEKEAMLDPSLPIPYMHSALREYQTVLPAVASVCRLVLRGGGSSGGARGARILELLHDACETGVPTVRAAIERILKRCLLVWYNQTLAWLLHGVLMDPYGEYLVQHNTTALATPLGQLADPFAQAAWAGEDATAEDGWNTEFTLRPAMLPLSMLPLALAQRILFVGKAVQVLRRAAPEEAPFDLSSPSKDEAKSLEPRLLASEDARLAAEAAAAEEAESAAALHLSDAELRELSEPWEALKRRGTWHCLSVDAAVAAAHQVVARRLWRLVVRRGRLLAHLGALRDYLLLGNGGLYHDFLADSALLTPAARPWMASRAAAVLGAAFERAASTCGVEDDPLFRRVRLQLAVPGFDMKSFADTSGFSLSGSAIHDAPAAAVWLCRADSSSSGGGGGGGGGTGGGGGNAPAAAAESRGSVALSCGAIWADAALPVLEGFSTVAELWVDKTMTVGLPGSSSGASVSPRANISLLFRPAAGDSVAPELSGGIAVCLTLPVNGSGSGGSTSGLCLVTTLAAASHAAAGSENGGTAEEIAPGIGAGKIIGRAAIPADLLPGGDGPLSIRVKYGEPNMAYREVGGSTSGSGGSRGGGGNGSGGSWLHVYINDWRGERQPLLDVSLPAPIGAGSSSPGANAAAFIGAAGLIDWAAAGTSTSLKLMRWRFAPGRAGGAAEGAALSGPSEVKVILGGGRLASTAAVARDSSDEIKGAGGSSSGYTEAGWLPLGVLGGLAWLTATYSPQWPLPLILSCAAIAEYGVVFSLLCRVRAAGAILEGLWHGFAQAQGAAAVDRVSRGASWALRAEMSFVVANLFHYLQADVVEVEYRVLQEAIKSAADFDAVLVAHQRYLMALRQRSYVDVPDIVRAINRILALTHTFSQLCAAAAAEHAESVAAADAAAAAAGGGGGHLLPGRRRRKEISPPPPLPAVLGLAQRFAGEAHAFLVVLERVGASELALRLNFSGYYS